MEYPFKIYRALDVGLRQQIVQMGNAIWEALTGHEADLTNPHEVALEQLSDVTVVTPEVGTGVVYTGLDPDRPYETLNVWVTAAYGGINLTSSVGFPDIGLAWETVLFDAATLTTPRGITQDFANNGILIDVQGVYLITAGVMFNFTEAQAGRNIQIRLYNATKAVGSQATLVAIGRNQDGLNFSTSILFEIPDADTGDLYQIQVSALTAGDTLTGVTEVTANFNANAVSEYRG